MTSKTLSLHDIKIKDLQTEISKRHIWINAISVLIMVCYYILGLILNLARGRRLYRLYDSPGSDVTMRQYLSGYTGQMIGMNSATCVITIVIAVLSGFAVFYFLYKTQSVDFYLSQPITRKCQFINIYLNGLCTFAVLDLIFTITGIGIAGAMNAMTIAGIGYVLINYLRNVLLFFALYNLTILAVLVSRNLLTAVIVAFIFITGDMLISTLIEGGLKSTYFATYYNPRYVLGARLTETPHILSPLYNHFAGMRVFSDIYEEANPLSGIFKFDILTLVFSIVVLMLAYKAYMVRKAEDIGTGVTYPIIKNILKLIVAVPMAVTAAMIVDIALENTFGGYSVMSVIILIFVAAIVCMLTEVICAGNIKAAFKNIWHFLIAGICAIAVFAIFKSDVFGYDSFVPDLSKVESCALFKEYSYRTMYDENGEFLNTSRYSLMNMDIEDKESVAKIAELGQATIRNNRIFQNYVYRGAAIPESAAMSDTVTYGMGGYTLGNDAIVSYRLKNGKIVIRNIYIPSDIDEDLMNNVIGSDGYRDCAFGLDLIKKRMEKENLTGRMSYDVGFAASNMAFSEEMLAEFLDCYDKDLENYDYSLAAHESPVGLVNCDNNMQMYTNSIYYTFAVYKEYTNTLEFLKKYNIYTESNPSPESVVKADIYMTVCDEETQRALYDCNAVFSEKENIERIVGLIEMAPTDEWFLSADGCNVTLTFNAGPQEGDTLLNEYTAVIYPEKMPEDILKKIMENVVYVYN